MTRREKLKNSMKVLEEHGEMSESMWETLETCIVLHVPAEECAALLKTDIQKIKYLYVKIGILMMSQSFNDYLQ